MTLFEIAMFKRFMHNKGYESLFIGMYRSVNRIEKNPESLEKYMRDADLTTVFTDAFYFVPNADYGYNFWHAVQRIFMDYMEDGNNIGGSLYKVTGMYKYLLKDYDTEKYWKNRARTDAAKRYGVVLERAESQSPDETLDMAYETTSKYCPKKASEY
jgi:hypothetical protein